MKKFFIAIVALAAAVACSNDDIISIDRQAIGFGNPFVENSVRADYSDGQDLTKFNVYGTVTGTAGTVNIFEGVEVKGNVGDAVWSYAEQYNQYWIPGADYNFAAVVDATVAKGDYNMPSTLTTIADATSNLEDMLYAEALVAGAQVTDTYNTPVAFTFSHLLSKVHFTVNSNATGGYYHTVTGIKVSNFESGTYTIDSDTWAGTTAKNVEFGDITEKVTSASSKSNASLLLVPNAEPFKVEFTVNLYKGTTLLNTTTYADGDADTTNNAISVDTDLVKGNSYNFTINCKVGKLIDFSVGSLDGWDSDTSITIP